jgi:hypothetical protein
MAEDISNSEDQENGNDIHNEHLVNDVKLSFSREEYKFGAEAEPMSSSQEDVKPLIMKAKEEED